MTAAGKTKVEFELAMPNARLWDTEDPYLYTLRAAITENGIEKDSDEMVFGVRVFEMDAEQGLRLNGRPMKLRGGCIHHDHGLLGAADYPAACRRKLTLLKKAGFNAVRIAHNPPSLNLLLICGSETQVLNFYKSWKATLENNHVIGDFTWTAYDNLGEAGMGKYLWERDGRVEGIGIAAYPWRACYQGDFDLCGYRRPQSYFREAVWIGGTEPRIFTTHPEHYGEGFTGTGWHWRDVQDSRTFGDAYIGKPVPCEVYTDADEIV